MGLISRVSSRTYRQLFLKSILNKMPINKEKLAAMQARGPQAKVGGARRKKKVTQSKNQVSDDKKIQQTLKKFSCSNLPGIDEVNMFKEDGNVIHFKNPKVTASPTSNTFTVAGHNEVKKITGLADIPETGNFDEAEEDAVE